MRNTSALRFTNGSAQAVTAAAASSINNLGSFTVAMWVDLTTVAPAAQRNFFGKSTGNSRVVGFINATTISVQYGSSVSAPTATATTTNCPGVAASQPVFIAFVVDAGVDTGPIVAQVSVPVLDSDDVETLHERIKVAERDLLVDVVGRMANFERHRKNAKVAPEFEAEPWRDAGYVAWLGWGGDTGVSWAAEIVERGE